MMLSQGKEPQCSQVLMLIFGSGPLKLSLIGWKSLRLTMVNALRLKAHMNRVVKQYDGGLMTGQ